ncbi:hypothetical protein CJD36_021955 [Flavipsychrobacter stenotrophus]|uniref:Secretion system C-terminal sorting domain-containing protein n=1 Tax=Flavipsychrobacter stenotrophus TaxID=2077091 RepID=A0A2S7SQM9_9BACT|nr:T9SS type A sorting domain-containing protein [Flavipsychrobacter stenotrophus]PQJ08931.1 hypothetical protein CJD36_021955 [Flavipsychrobacter stenotrophus]
MKKFYAFLVATCICGTAANAQSHLIHYWHFNNYTLAQHTDTIHGISADYSTISVTTAKILYAKKAGTSAAYATYIDSIQVGPADYDTINARMGVPDAVALRVRNPSDSMHLLFYIPTTNYKNIKLTYATQSSSVTKGQLHQIFDYSVDSGVTWRTSGLSIPSDSAWLVYKRSTISLSDIQANNNPKLVFRITFSGNDTGVKGNNRFDNVTVEGDTLSSVSVNNVVNNGHTTIIYPNPVHDQLNFDLVIGTANICVLNMQGQQQLAAVINDKERSVNVGQLSPGIYFVIVKTTDREEKIKFIKQ